MALLASNLSDSSEACSSVTCPAGKALQSRPDTVGNSARGAASTARRSCSANMTSPPGQRPAREELPQDHRITGRAPPLPEMTHGNESGLTGRQPEELSKILGIPSGAFAAPLEAPLIAGLPHEVESEVAHDRHVLGSMPLA